MNRRSFLATPLPALASAANAEDEYGGLRWAILEATGRFRLAEWRGGRWLITPGGHPVIPVALCHAQMAPKPLRVKADTTTQRFGDDAQRYAEDLLGWMRAAGFNSFSYGVPAFTGGRMNRLSELQLVPGFINGPQFPDLFDPSWRAEAAAKIAQAVPAASSDTRVIGHVLSNPLLFSPRMERPRIWRDGTVKRQNYMMAIRSLTASAAGKKAYIGYLRQTYGSFGEFRRRRGAPANCSSFDDLLARDLSKEDNYETLHADDAAFYTSMWSDLTRFFVSEIRKHDPRGIIFSYRFIRVQTWPDPWLDAMLAGVGPHVDAFAVELYGEDPYRAIVDGIGEQTGKPAMILDGMRRQEFVYSDFADDREEAADYQRMYRSLLGSHWFLGGSVCEYRQKLPNNPFYSPRPNDARTGLRHPDYSEREPLLAMFRKLHPARYELRLSALAR